MTSPNVFTTTDTTFATDVLQSPTPVLVDFQHNGVRATYLGAMSA